MYPELGHRPINRLGVSNRAYILERSVPYLAGALSAGVVGLGPLLAMAPNLRKRKVGNIDYSGFSATPMPTPAGAPSNAVKSAVSSISGDISVISDPLTVGRKVVTLVGADTDRNFYAKCYLGNTTGWGFKSSVYRRSLLFGNRLLLHSGDIFSTGLNDNVKPTYITAKGTGTLGSVYGRNYDDDVIQVLKTSAIGNSALFVKSSLTNMASHFCFPVGIYRDYGSNTTGVRYAPYGLKDIFGTYSGYTGQELYDQQYPHLENTTGSNIRLYGNDPSLSNSMDKGLYFSQEMRVTLHNPKDYSQTFEVYFLTPRRDTQTSPLFDYQEAYTQSGEHQSSNDGGGSYQLYHPTANLFAIKAMRDKWRCIKKKKIQVAGKGTVKFVMRVPLSLIQYNKLQSVTRGASEMSLKGLTGWFYVKCYGLYGYDSQNFVDGAPSVVANPTSMAYAPSEYIITGDNSITVLRQWKNMKPVMDQRAINTEAADSINITENDENNEITI